MANVVDPRSEVAPEALQAIAQSQLSEIAQHASDAIKKIHEQEDAFREQLELRVRKLSAKETVSREQSTRKSWLAAIAFAIAIVAIGTIAAFVLTPNREVTSLVLFSMMTVAALVTAGTSFFVRNNVAS